jgi:hypothetical protein
LVALRKTLATAVIPKLWFTNPMGCEKFVGVSPENMYEVLFLTVGMPFEGQFTN